MNSNQGIILAIANQKGGVGKTTTAVNLGAALVLKGYKVLLVDTDQQGNATLSCGYDPDKLEGSLFDILAAFLERKPRPIEEVVLAGPDGLHLVPANKNMSMIDNIIYKDRIPRIGCLKDVLAPIRDYYDFILLDCGPQVNMVQLCVLAAADEMLIPLQAHFLASHGMLYMLESIEEAKRDNVNPNLKIRGILITFAENTRLSKEVINLARQSFKDEIKVFETMIPKTVALADAPTTGKSIHEAAPGSAGSKAYMQLANELEAEYAIIK